jgi:hypothetical protein
VDNLWYTPENTPPGTSQELLDTLNEEAQNLRLQWEAFNYHNTNSPTGSTILPAALCAFAFHTVHTSYHEQDDTKVCGEEDVDMLKSYAAFGSIMFKFGAWCWRNGVLDINLTEILDSDDPDLDMSDDTIRRFLGNA